MPENPNINFEIDPADVVTVPIDDTLSIEGEAADAKAVGDALALKADKSEIATAIKVDGQSADAQGEIVLLASHIPMDASATPQTVAQKIAALEGRTGADIPFDGTAGSQTIAQKVNSVAAGAVIAGNKATLEGSIADESTHVEALTVNGATLPLRDAGAVRSVNSIPGDADGNVRITNVETANNLVADDAQANIGLFVLRAAGGTTSIADGKAWLTQLRGYMEHTGEVQESLTMTVNAAQREEGETPITATIDEDAFKAVVTESSTVTLTYTTDWSANPELIGVTVTGTPVSGDEIVIVYVKGNRGTITPATPTSFRSTGWNLYSHANGYARVVKYSDEYGFRVEGDYTSLAFSYTLTGERSAITPAAGNFNIPADGYVWVTGGNASTTCVYMTWSDWTAGYDGNFEAYTESVISIATLMSEYFPDGLLAVGAVTDEIDFSLQKVTVRIEKLAYSEQTIAALEEAGRDYVTDTDSIYAVLETPVSHVFQISSEYTVSDHGMELITGTDVPVNTYTLYGQNLRDKLRTDVVTISQQQLTAAQKSQVCDNIGALDADDVVNNLTNPSTTTIPSSAAVANIVGANNAGFHNCIYRGRNLGTSVTAAQWSAIGNGTFDDLFIGDYWTINGVNWRIAGFDYWYRCGDTECTTHHVVIVPDSNLARAQMNSTNITTGAYIGSDYYTGANGNTGKATAQSAINGAFGSGHILNHREHLQNATTNGYESAGTWYDSTFELMTERMVYGCDIFHNVKHGTNIPNFYSIDTAQLPLFRHDHSRICNRADWWLRDVASATYFAYVYSYGYADYASASTSYGVRPAFGIRA